MRRIREKAAALLQTDLKGDATGGAPMDYKKEGLTAGIEIHQQLNTQEKLFCHCQTLLRIVIQVQENSSAISESPKVRWVRSTGLRRKR